jgi:hypothetical protein
MKARLAMVAVAMLAASQARAAEITQRDPGNDVIGGYVFDRVITVSGELVKGDADRFRDAVSGALREIASAAAVKKRPDVLSRATRRFAMAWLASAQATSGSS